MPCNKMAFETKADLKAFIDDPRTKGHRRAMTPYQCSICRKWHITSQSKAQQRRFARFTRRNNRGNS